MSMYTVDGDVMNTTTNDQAGQAIDPSLSRLKVAQISHTPEPYVTKKIVKSLHHELVKQIINMRLCKAFNLDG